MSNNSKPFEKCYYEDAFKVCNKHLFDRDEYQDCVLDYMKNCEKYIRKPKHEDSRRFWMHK